ncbi:hypothetical protein BCY91_16700 [Pelobium manganitolerans]|uniref:Major facilitator superfamily (MFS) profile domain-containing protein n=1 Tax=Pelobium manganitolerans TaxID=1842495 RepID=A0A419S7T3_9SPHI|nr:hypothetical protein BCY91_16700 [Pelobium manganitolerans]
MNDTIASKPKWNKVILLSSSQVLFQTASILVMTLLEIVKQKNTLTALISSAVGYSVMIMIMTATKLAMCHCGHSSDDAATVIQCHVLGMFVPSFFTETLIEKFGVRKVILTGIIILCLHVSLSLTGTDFFNFVSGLILLVVGCNFIFVGGSKVYRAEEKEKTQTSTTFRFLRLLVSPVCRR